MFTAFVSGSEPIGLASDEDMPRLEGYFDAAGGDDRSNFKFLTVLLSNMGQPEEGFFHLLQHESDANGQIVSLILLPW
jgi:hypothetical protein